ncbi:MAG: DUF4384 domain-containing protein [Deltaproteobacteria bacterium]|jgi:hypothetical protein|nr:DUF4384 domain-containing protein [Deltaproteobacteria bacterium]
MTLVETPSSHGNHLPELALRRYRAGEFSAEQCQETDRHLAVCAPCRSRLRMLVEEQRAFEREIPFERFAGGVERARRVPRQRPRRIWFAGLGGALAAAAVALFLARTPATGFNRTKGSTVQATVRVASAVASAQRSVPPGSQEVLEPGDRVRLGYRSEEPRYLAAVSVDDTGEITLLYPETGPALAISPTATTTYLPDSLEFTGEGREKVFLFLARKPFDSMAAKQAVKTALESAKGDLAILANPTFAGGQQVFSWLFRKP